MLQPFSERYVGLGFHSLVAAHPWGHGYYIEIDGAPRLAVNLLQWCLALELTRRVAEADIGGLWVSTVFLGLEHAGGMLYETMIYHRDVKEWDDMQWRYRTREEALKGHDEAVALAVGMVE